MKISIGSKIFDGPWGGGNLFVINLKNYLIDKGHEVIHDLNSDDIDLILMTQPLKKSESASYSISDIIKYVKYVNNNCLVLHRINECDERKDTNYVNESIIDASKYADGRIFVSQWIRNLYENIGMNMDNSHVILSGSNKTVFNSKNKSIKKPDEAYRFVTHHWGNNWNKGFDNYQQLDQLVADESFKYDIEFTYIGNLPKNFEFYNSNHIQPLDGENLAKELKKNHIYITGSINEPSGNHHIEGAMCGLPILYINSGGIPEYCDGYGVVFEQDNFKEKLIEIIERYDFYNKEILTYENNSISMSEKYEELFKDMFNNKKKFIDNRDLDKKNSPFNFIKKYTFLIKRKIKLI